MAILHGDPHLICYPNQHDNGKIKGEVTFPRYNINKTQYAQQSYYKSIFMCKINGCHDDPVIKGHKKKKLK